MSTWMWRLVRRVRAGVRPAAVDRELDEEVRLHIELETEDLERTLGLSRDEARRRALASFGGVERYRQVHRETRRLPWLDCLWEDLRNAFRQVRTRPGFTLAVVLTLALGIGANTTMFSIVDRMLLRPPPMLRDAARTHRIYITTTSRGREHTTGGVQYARYLDLTRWSTAFVRTAEFTTRSLAVGVGTEAEEVTIGIVSAEFFDFFEASPAAGRYFTVAEDTVPRGAAVTVLSYGEWLTRYGGSADALGQVLHIGGGAYTIVGVAPRGFVGVWPKHPPAAYIPITTFAAEEEPGRAWWTGYSWTFAEMMAERRPGVSLAAATADLTTALRRSFLAKEGNGPGAAGSVAEQAPRGQAASILSDRGPRASSLSRVMAWISGVALVVWLIACANVANLLLARALRRRREIAVRLALGVSRRRLAAQLLTESLVLALLGGLAGVAVAQWGGSFLRSLVLSSASATVLDDPRALVAAGATALIAGLLTGLAPLVQANRTDLTKDLKSGAREGTVHGSRTRSALLLFQAALSVLLLMGAGLFVRSLERVRATPLGYDPASVALVRHRERGMNLDSATTVALRRSLLEAAQHLPEVESASPQSTTPFWSSWSDDIFIAGMDSVSTLGQFDLNAVGPEYFATMGTPILRGRGIGSEDRHGAPRVMVVSAAMAERLWPGEDAIGKCVRLSADTMPCTTVVGIAGNIKSRQLDDDSGLFYYVSWLQYVPEYGGLFVRTRGPATASTEAIRRALQQVMPGVSYVTVTPLTEVVGGETVSWRLGAAMFVGFGLLALTLAAVGLYGVVAYDVTQRTHELGVRMALGARVADVLRLILHQGLRPTVVGILLGVGIALVLGRWVEPLLFEVSPRDPGVFVAVPMTLLAVAVLASVIPARRAVRVDPVEALRTE